MTTDERRRVDERPPADADAALVARLRAGDEAAVTELVERYQRPLQRLAEAYVPTRAVAEEVVQDTWIAVLRGIGAFEGRSTFRTWLFRILRYQAQARGERERRVVPLSSIVETAPDEPAVDPSRFLPADDPRWPGHWSDPPADWGSAEARVLGLEARAVIESALGALAPAQRLVMTLRDVEGWDADEVCAALELTPGNQRVLLHRARARVRASVDDYFREAAHG